MRAVVKAGLLLSFGAILGAMADDPYVTTGSDGRLSYWQDARGNRIPDFSNCGYRGGGVTLPEVPVKATVSPIEGDCTALIQAAIDQAAALPEDENGHRGAVLLKKGTYRLENPVRIKANGIVLRGEGQGEDGTVLVATKRQQYALIKAGQMGGAVEDSSGNEPSDALPHRPWAEVKDSRRQILDDYVPVGARSFRVQDAASFHPGDTVVVFRPSTAEWIHALGMDAIPPRKDGGKIVQWTEGSKDLRFDRVVTAVKGDTVEIDAPICNALDAKFGGGYIFKYEMPQRLREIGVENMRGVSEYSGETDEKHGWTFISFGSVMNSWVRDVTAVHFGSNCVAVGATAKWITVQDSSCLDAISKITGGRRYSFLNSGQLVLFQRCFAREGRHDYVFGATVPGPNAFVDCSSENAHADSGPHQRWSVGMLFDNVRIGGDELNLHNRGNFGTGHGWTGANSVIWNCTAKLIDCWNPPTAQNWAIGCLTDNGAPKGNGYWASYGTPAPPESLYLSQLAERLGPQAVKNIGKSARP